MTFPGIHFAKPHAIVHHPLSDSQVLSHLFEPIAARFGAELASFRFSREGWCGAFETRDAKTHIVKEWVITYFGNDRSEIAPNLSDNKRRWYFEDFEASLMTPSMKAACEEYGKKALALGTEPLPPQPFVLSVRKVVRYLWLPLVNKLAGPQNKGVTLFQFSAENWCAKFVLDGKLKGAIVYRGNKACRTILGLSDLLFDRIDTLFNTAKELPS